MTGCDLMGISWRKKDQHFPKRLCIATFSLDQGHRQVDNINITENNYGG